MHLSSDHYSTPVSAKKPHQVLLQTTCHLDGHEPFIKMLHLDARLQWRHMPPRDPSPGFEDQTWQTTHGFEAQTANPLGVA
jgi:hypothetical protein